MDIQFRKNDDEYTKKQRRFVYFLSIRSIDI